MTKCQKPWEKDASRCNPSELFQDNKISLADIGDNQSGIINGAVYHQIYCVPPTVRATTINKVTRMQQLILRVTVNI